MHPHVLNWTACRRAESSVVWLWSCEPLLGSFAPNATVQCSLTANRSVRFALITHKHSRNYHNAPHLTAMTNGFCFKVALWSKAAWGKLQKNACFISPVTSKSNAAAEPQRRWATRWDATCASINCNHVGTYGAKEVWLIIPPENNTV